MICGVQPLNTGLSARILRKGILSFPVDFKRFWQGILILRFEIKILGKSENDLKIAIFSLPGLKSATISLYRSVVKNSPIRLIR